MGKILDAFAENELYTTEVIEKRSPQRQRLIEKSDELHSKLEQKLNSEDNELLEQLLEVIFDESYCYAQANFIRVYRLGILMATEIFSEQDSFLHHP